MNEDAILSIAKGLLFTYTKAKQGTPVKWAQISPEDRRLWLRLARQAVRRATEQGVIGR